MKTSYEKKDFKKWIIDHPEIKELVKNIKSN
jgi:hypothetical protein